VDVFGAASTTEDILSGINLRGKRIFVTGVSAGLGVETARSLAAHGAYVVGAARDLKKAEAATAQVRKDAEANGESFELVALDLASLKSVRACAEGLLKKGEPFDVVIANAGVMATPFTHTADHFETQFGTNHLGHFVLVNRIAPLIRKGGRLINLASAGHRFSNVDLEDPNFERTPYDPWVAYGRSKTANILFAVDFDRRHRGNGIRAAAVHPGGIQTELDRHLDPVHVQKTIEQMNKRLASEGTLDRARHYGNHQMNRPEGRNCARPRPHLRRERPHPLTHGESRLPWGCSRPHRNFGAAFCALACTDRRICQTRSVTICTKTKGESRCLY
jgi:NAD(P)-dependent dehydrogenase (short-subunit alcohol dehydrogenase family)